MNKQIGRRRFIQAVPAAVAATVVLPARPAAQGRGNADAAEVRNRRAQGSGAGRRTPFHRCRGRRGVGGVSRNLDSFEALRKLDIPLDTEPAMTFRPYLPGKQPAGKSTRNAKLAVSRAEKHPDLRVPRGPRVRTGDRALRAHREPQDHVYRSDENVPRAAQALRRSAPLRRHAHRGACARAGGEGGSGNQGGPLPRAAPRNSVGREGSFRHEGHCDDLGR